MKSKILFNALGIQDSGGISVLIKTLSELKISTRYKIYVFLYRNSKTTDIGDHYIESTNIDIIYVNNKSFIYRLLFENIYYYYFFRKYNIDIIYNFSGSAQIFYRKHQLVKIQNILFYSKTLDAIYLSNNKYFEWIKKVKAKRYIFLLMLRSVKYIEIQSEHVKLNVGDFLSIENVRMFVKSDFIVSKRELCEPKKYRLSEKITILYIVGPHYNLQHKNIEDFIYSMSQLENYNIDYEIKITLSREQLKEYPSWKNELDSRTQYLGYISHEKIIQLFQDNCILISTSIIETLGLHVIEAIINGVIAIVPELNYSACVYGNDVRTYKLFDPESLSSEIINVIHMDEKEVKITISKNQEYLFNSEHSKHRSILHVFDIIQKENNYV